jgi:cytochrome oxidase Cu insertion factor (SCO1/SenC/PrrC family)
MSALAATILCALVHPSARAQPGAQQSPLPDIQKLAPQVGTRVPDFTLLDQTGKSRTLKSLMGPRGLMLVFFRSADW